MAVNHLILVGFKSCGKSTVGRLLARALKWRFVDLDERVERLYSKRHGAELTCRDIFRHHGEEFFRKLEASAVSTLRHQRSAMVLAAGGGAPLREETRELLAQLGTICYLQVTPEELFERISRRGFPPFLEQDPSVENLTRLWLERDPVYRSVANLRIETGQMAPQDVVARILPQLKEF
jgi:shikimate kinase